MVASCAYPTIGSARRAIENKQRRPSRAAIPTDIESTSAFRRERDTEEPPRKDACCWRMMPIDMTTPKLQRPTPKANGVLGIGSWELGIYIRLVRLRLIRLRLLVGDVLHRAGVRLFEPLAPARVVDERIWTLRILRRR